MKIRLWFDPGMRQQRQRFLKDAPLWQGQDEVIVFYQRILRDTYQTCRCGAGLTQMHRLGFRLSVVQRMRGAPLRWPWLVEILNVAQYLFHLQTDYDTGGELQIDYPFSIFDGQ